MEPVFVTECEGEALSAQEARAALAQMQQMGGPQITPKVAMALRFVEHCNEHMGPIVIQKISPMTGEVDTRLYERTLPGQQEQVFNLALRCLGEFFGSKP
jgi:hypothetical protein